MSQRGVVLVLFFLVVALCGGYILFPEVEGLEQVFNPRPVHLLAVGDMLFDRSIREKGLSSNFEHTFSCIKEELMRYDFVFGNLESPITNNPSVSQGTKPGSEHNYTFTSPPEAALALYTYNVRLVNLGNNHMLNFSREGLLRTKEYLDAAGVRYFGDPDSAEEERVARMDIRGVPLSFVNWSDWTSDKTDHTVAQVRKEAGAGRTVIVYTHWGEEYQPPLPRVRALARSFIDAGAEIVIGSHPHIIQEHEQYRGKWIYYSLGNFIFDQYWNEEVSTGLALDLSISTDGIAVEERLATLSRDGRTCFKN